MTSEHILREKLRKIEALFAGAATSGERMPPALPRNGFGSASISRLTRNRRSK